MYQTSESTDMDIDFMCINASLHLMLQFHQRNVIDSIEKWDVMLGNVVYIEKYMCHISAGKIGERINFAADHEPIEFNVHILYKVTTTTTTRGYLS